MESVRSRPKVLGRNEGLRLVSGPGRDLVFKVTGDDTDGALDFFEVEVAPLGGPPLHVHHRQEEYIHILEGSYKVRIGDEFFRCEPGGFAYMPAGLAHAFVNLTEEVGRIIVVYTPGGGHRFYEEMGPLARSGGEDRAAVAAVFEKHGLSLLGPPLEVG